VIRSRAATSINLSANPDGACVAHHRFMRQVADSRPLDR
jgi:hypothetical protein